MKALPLTLLAGALLAASAGTVQAQSASGPVFTARSATTT